jgi:hypothetical protein
MRGQASIEFLACVAFLLLLFAVLHTYGIAKDLRYAEEARDAGGVQLCSEIAAELSAMALASGQGGIMQLRSSGYNVTVANGTVSLDWEDGSYACAAGATVRNASGSAVFAMAAGAYLLNSTKEGDGIAVYVQKI